MSCQTPAKRRSGDGAGRQAMQLERCGNCRYFVRASTATSHHGECVRWPPTLYFGADKSPLAAWPPVIAGQWCGEWKEEISLDPDMLK